MEYSKYSGLLVYYYWDAYVWLNQCINSLYEQIERYRETDFTSYSQDYIRNLQTWLRANRDRADKLSEEFKWTPRNASFEEFKDRLRHMPEDRRPAFPDPEVTESLYPLLSSVWNRLNQQSNVLDRWPDIDVDAFINELNLALRDLVECRTIIMEHDICKSEGSVASGQDESSEEVSFFLEEDEDEVGFHDLRHEIDPIDIIVVYNSILSKLRDVRFSLLICIDRCNNVTDTDKDGKQRFWDCRKAVQADAAAALEGLGQLYSHLDGFLAWFASVYGEDSLSRFEPSPASVLLDAWNDVSELVDTLKKKAEKVGSELGLADSETTDDIPKATYSSSTDAFDLYEELDRKFAELYGGKKTSSDDDTDISPIFRRESFKDWLKRMIEGIEDLLQELMPVTRQ